MHLSDKTPLVLESGHGVAREAVWTPLKLGVIPRVGAVVPAGMQLVMPETTARPGDVGLVTIGPSRLESGGRPIPFRIEWRSSPSDGVHRRLRTLLRASLLGASADEPWADYRFSLTSVAGTRGSIVMRSTRAWRFWQSPQELVLYDLAISDEESLDLERARSFRELRIRNEQINMDAYYKHAMFQVSQAAAQPSSESPPVPAPAAVVSATKYSHERLKERVGVKTPPFAALLKAKTDELLASRPPGSSNKVRVLSLCSGAARSEFGLVRDLSPDLVSMTLLHVTPNLLEVAARTFSSWGPVRKIVADVNGLDLKGEQFDVVLCVSGLHHVVELEHVIVSVSKAIGDTGEFWSIAETMGRNGGRMWPEAYAVANRYFSRLPEKYRFNRHTNSVDHVLQNIDYSIGCFEGIRCEAIEPTLLKYLEPVHVSKHNCIVWKLFSLAYSDNYDVASEADRKLIDTAVDLDVDLHRHGRYGIELHGVYRRKH